MHIDAMADEVVDRRWMKRSELTSEQVFHPAADKIARGWVFSLDESSVWVQAALVKDLQRG